MSHKSLEQVCKKQQDVRLKAILGNRNFDILPDQDNAQFALNNRR